MSNIAPTSSTQPPPRYEEIPLRPPSDGEAPCLCHKRYDLIAREVTEIYKNVSEKKGSIYQEWEYGRMRALAGTIMRNVDADCTEVYNCHEEYALLSSRIMGMVRGLGALGKTISSQDRTKEELISWERHAGDIKWLAAMLRECETTKVDAAWFQEVEKAELKRRLAALEEKVEKLLSQ